MALTTSFSKRVEIPHEPGEWMEVKRLSWRQEDMAKEIKAENLLKQMKAMGPDMVASVRKTARGQEAPKDRKADLDQLFVLQAGIISWSYDEEVSQETIERLDSETADWAFNEILKANEKTKEEVKNG